ncbi:MAG: class I SAM-dependent methyltransferase [Pseudomonadota bacterium]
MNHDDINRKFSEYFAPRFEKHGSSPQGVDWGPVPEDHSLRMDRMLELTSRGATPGRRISILDVGCGYGMLLDEIKRRQLNVDYHGIDLSEAMIAAARERHPEAGWTAGDILKADLAAFDYVICNGLLMLKLDIPLREMDAFAKSVVRRLFDLCRIGVAFNMMSTHVNFTVPHTFYRNPVEWLAWCMTELSPRVRLDHAYPLFDFTIHLYREDAPGLIFGSHRSAGGQSV